MPARYVGPQIYGRVSEIMHLGSFHDTDPSKADEKLNPNHLPCMASRACHLPIRYHSVVLHVFSRALYLRLTAIADR